MPKRSPDEPPSPTSMASHLAAHVFVKHHAATLPGPHTAHDPLSDPQPVVLSCSCHAPLVRFTLPDTCECGHPRVDAAAGGHIKQDLANSQAGGCQASIATDPRIEIGEDGKRRAIADVEDCPCSVFTWRPDPIELRDTVAQELWEDHVGVKVGAHVLVSIRGGQEEDRWYVDAECGCRQRERVYGATPPDPQLVIDRWAAHVVDVLELKG